MTVLRYTRTYDVKVDRKLFDTVQDYDEQHDTSYAFELIDACTRAADGGNTEGVMFLQPDGDGENTHTWYDEHYTDKTTLYEAEYSVEEQDADFDVWED